MRLQSKILAVLTLAFSPTRFFVEQFKYRVDEKDRAIDIWNTVFRVIMLLNVLGLYLVGTSAATRRAPPYLGFFGLWLFPFSRVTELLLAFYKDAFQRFKYPGSENKERRLKLLVFSYLEVAVQFGILYFCFPAGFFKPDFGSIFDAIYFSVATITTVGYGDFAPTQLLSRLACVYELAVGFVLIIFALGSYLAMSNSNVPPHPPVE